MDYKDIITIEPGKRGGKPCIRGMRITVYDVLGYLASGMTRNEILDDFPYLTETDIRACLAYAADRRKSRERIVTAIEFLKVYRKTKLMYLILSGGVRYVAANAENMKKLAANDQSPLVASKHIAPAPSRRPFLLNLNNRLQSLQ